MISQGQATDSEIVCISFPQHFSSNPFPNASSQGQGMPALTGKEGRRQPHLRHLAVASWPNVGFRDALLVWDPSSGWTRRSQCKAASRAREPRPRRRASGYHCGRCGWVWGGGAAGRVQPEVLLGRTGGSATSVGGAGGAGVNASPAPRSDSVSPETWKGGGGSQSCAHPEPGGSRAGSSAVPPRSPAQVAGADGRRRPSGLRACLADVRSVLGYASSRAVLCPKSAVRSECAWTDRPVCASWFPVPRAPDGADQVCLLCLLPSQVTSTLGTQRPAL